MNDDKVVYLFKIMPDVVDLYYQEYLDQMNADVKTISDESTDNAEKLNDLTNRLNKLTSHMDIDFKLEYISTEDHNVIINEQLQKIIERQFENEIEYKDESLTDLDLLVASTAGIVAILIDIFLVGTPNFNKGNFKIKNCSKLTELLRNASEKGLSPFLKTLEKNFKVPYDKSVGDGLTPNNHRLRSFSHDPFFGLFFSFFDFVFQTTSYINGNGNFAISFNASKSYKPIDLYKSVLWFMGHLISDFSTKRGIPIPGFVLTQFFKNDDYDFAKTFEKMYVDGYDMRHLGSMSITVVIKKLILDAYIELVYSKEETIYTPLADKEVEDIQIKIKKEKIKFVANSISVGGNVIKFLAPPNSGNLAALNTPEWYSFINSCITQYKINQRDKSVEEIMYNRKQIDINWNLLSNE